MAAPNGEMGGFERELHEAAVVAAGYHDFGDDAYREGLGRLLEAIELSEYKADQRELIRRATVVPALRGRLYSERGWSERPRCLSNPVNAPLVICGLPRTGTTALHQLLSMDRRIQGLNGWLVYYPMPRPPRDRWPSLPEYREVARVHEAAISGPASVKAAHVRTADDVDEPIELMTQCFVSNTFPAIFHLPSYDEWFRVQDQRPTYRRLADNLRLIGSNDPEKPWLLQNPNNILSLDALLDVFPGARIVWTHRQPARALESLSSLLATVRTSVLGSEVRVDDIATRELSLWSQGVKNAMDVRSRRPEHFHDVDFRRFVADPMGTARDIYDRFGINLDQSTESAMEQWVVSNPQRKHGTYTYNSDAYGLDDKLVELEFADYIERFSLSTGRA